MFKNLMPTTVMTGAYNQKVDVPIGADIGKNAPPDGASFGDSTSQPVLMSRPESGGTWLGDPIHFDRA